MTAKRVLFACELGNGLRQADRLRPVAAALAAAGHACAVAMPRGAPAEELARAAGLDVLDAPVWRAEPPPGFLAASFADILLQVGYVTAEALESLLVQWIALFDRAAPDLIVADFAPTAMLAARATGRRLAAMGDGIGPPPAVSPLPGMRPWSDVAPHAVEAADARALAVVNPTLRLMGYEPLDRLADIFAADATFLCAFPELDHYEGRGEADYYGEIPPPPFGAPLDWPAGSAERVFVAMDSRHRPFRPLLAALRRLGLPAIVQAWGMTEEMARELSGPTMAVATAPVERAGAIGGADIVACQGTGVAAPALLAGKPLLMLPNPVEQMMTLHRVARQGLGTGLAPDADEWAADAAIRRLLDDRDTRQRAAGFARAYAGFDPAEATAAIAEECAALLA